MKKKLSVLVFCAILLALMVFIIAEDNSENGLDENELENNELPEDEEVEEQEEINETDEDVEEEEVEELDEEPEEVEEVERIPREGYACLEEKIDEKTCEELSLEENIFSVLATGKCLDELLGLVKEENCWGENGCDIKTTAQAIISLREQNQNVTPYVSWLKSKNLTSRERGMDWFAQLDVTDSQCYIEVEEGRAEFEIDSAERLREITSFSRCFDVENYRVKIKQICHDKEIRVNCDKSFEASFFFERGGIIYLSEKSIGGSANETIEHRLDAFCFGEGRCDYESTLWAMLALDFVNEDFSYYIPYTIAFAEARASEVFLPESFLYRLLGSGMYLVELENLQDREGYWEVGRRGRHYDTALALLALDESDAKDKAIEWMNQTQGEDGCWDEGEIVSNAFLLYSAWPRFVEAVDVPVEEDPVKSCVEEGHFCMSRTDCEELEGNIFDGLSCPGIQVCCSEKREEKTCEDRGGIFCSGEEECIGDRYHGLDVNDERCCVGECEIPVEPDLFPEDFDNKEECEDAGFHWYDDRCNRFPEPKEDFPWIWIVLLVLLIGLVVLGIVFKDKLRELFFKIKSKFGSKGDSVSRKPQGPSPPSAPPMRRPVERHIMPKQPQPQKRPMGKPPAKPKEEFEDILGKLKKMEE